MHRIAIFLSLLLPAVASANAPVASYIFPAGGQRGTKVNVRVGGLHLYQQCGFEMVGSGVTASPRLKRMPTTWFEGPLLPLPDSQRQEDYPKDMAGSVAIAADAALGTRSWRLWTSQGATPSMKFVVGDLPEIVEQEIDGDPIPVPVTLPLTINGRIFPRENIDVWSFQAKKGQTVRCEVNAVRIGSPLDARLEVRDPQGRRIAENDDYYGADPVLIFTAPADGQYQVHIQDTQTHGGQAYVYRLTLTGEPIVDRIYPLGGRRGSTVSLQTAGQNIPEKMQAAIPNDAAADHAHVFAVGAKRTNSVLLDIDDLPEYVKEQDLGKTIALPAILNGRIDKPGAVDTWKFQGKKGDTWEIELRAIRLGSRLDGAINVLDAGGKAVAKAEANPQDPALSFKVPVDGEYRVQVQDRFRSRGGPDFAYRLRVAAPPAPDFRLWLGSDAISLPRKGAAKLKVTAERFGGFTDPITLDVQGLPKGVTVTGIAMGMQASVELGFKAEEQAKIDVARLTIVGKSKPAAAVAKGKADKTSPPPPGKELARVAKMRAERGQLEVGDVLLAVALPTPFVIKGEYDMGFAARGGMHKRKYKIERNGFAGPIEISLADRQARHLQGADGPTIVVPAGATEFAYSAFLPPWMETGRTCRVCVMGVGLIKEPDGSEHSVSFSSVNQNEQLVAVIGPGRLAMEADRTSFTAEPGKTFAVPVRIKRGQGIDGPVTLELIAPAHFRGLNAAKATIPTKEERGQLTINCATPMSDAFNMPIIVRATLMHNGEPLVAEVNLDVQR